MVKRCGGSSKPGVSWLWEHGFQLYLIGQSGGISTLTGLWLAYQEGTPLWLVEVYFQLGLSFISLASQEASQVWVAADRYVISKIQKFRQNNVSTSWSLTVEINGLCSTLLFNVISNARSTGLHVFTHAAKSWSHALRFFVNFEPSPRYAEGIWKRTNHQSC